MPENHLDVVQRLHAAEPPEPTVDGALAFTLRVIAALPADEEAGLLAKPSGDNIAPYRGTLVSVGRIFYLDGTLIKILSDIPTTMSPIWDVYGPEPPSRYVRVSGPAPPPGPLPPPGPAPGDDDEPLLVLLDALERIADGMTGIAQGVNALVSVQRELQQSGVKVRLR